MLNTRIEIDLTDRPRHGRTQILVRCQLQDKQLIERIAKVCGMTLAEFVRTTVIKSARKIDEEMKLAEGKA
jgi:uncharacterized protein (DUF1778 family)